MNRLRCIGSARVGGRVLGMALAAGLTLAGGAVQAQPGAGAERDDLKPFPAAGPGQARRVIRLPAERDVDGLRVGIVVGRTMLGDCNRQVLPARIDERTAEGWGYTTTWSPRVGRRPAP